ncbi:cation:proton antiporter [Telluribacter humicola]|uniref:cation:proton antiporter n=1 Tax=Telluribacter humicola TaxID=1720261 RepID=UPI001A969047|nr:sodium:proton antiporter [Telluribacter humicola]
MDLTITYYPTLPMKDFAIALTCFSFLLLILGLVFNKLKRSVISEPMIAMAAGIVLGPHVLQVIDVAKWGSFEKILLVTSQLTISMALMATAFRVPKGYLKANLSLQSILVLLGMLGMCAISTVIIHLLFGLDWLLCFLIGAIITPTDPVTASSIVSGETARKLLPERIRHAISFESGANDGMAYSLVLLPLLLIQRTGSTWSDWFLKTILWETGGGVVLGLVIGYIASKALVKAKAAGWMAETSLLAFSLALGFFVLGGLELVHCNGIVGVFAAGYIANHILDTDEDIEQEEVQEAMERIFTVPIFILFGLILPWHDWFDLGWKAIALVVAILLFRRLPVVLALKPLLKNKLTTADLAFIGWFGPVGVAAMFYAVHTLEDISLHTVWVLTSLVVFGSTIVHGFTGYIFAKFYHNHTGEPQPEPQEKPAHDSITDHHI